MDNFGGISKIWLVLASNILRMNENESSASPVMKPGITWRMFQPGQYGSTLKVEPQTSESGTLYNVSATVRIPFQNSDDDGWMFLNGLTRHGVALKYMTLKGDSFVVGSKRFPLNMKMEELHASSPSQGYNGYLLTFTGKQLSQQLRIS